MSTHNPHDEEGDGCDHGHTGKICRPDPNDHGKDCDHHGNHGGVNEDHCRTTTTSPGTTTTTTKHHHGSTTTTVKSTGTTVVSTSTSLHPIDTTTTASVVTPTTAPNNPLANTGFAAEPFTALAFIFVAIGLLLKRARKAI